MKKILICTLAASLLLSSNITAQKKQEVPKGKGPVVRKGPSTVVGAWTLTYLEGADIAKLFPDKKPIIAIDPKRILISGFNGCNSFSGKIKIEGNKISFLGPIQQTLKACNGNGEQKFMDALNTVKSFAFSENEKLDLIAGDKGAMQFTRAEKAKSNTGNKPNRKK